MIVVQPGDLVISGINVAKGAIAVYQGMEPVTATIHYSSYIFDDSVVDLEYFKYFVKSPAFIETLKKQAKGGIKTEIKSKVFLPLEISLPDLPTQKQIVKRISENLKRVNELAKEIDRLAKENGVTVLGTGINPGLIMDLLVVLMTGCCEEVDHIVSRRVNSLSPFGPVVMHEQGIGITVDEFKEGVKTGRLSGHVGFHESIRMITDAIGWELSAPVTQSMEPIVTDVDRKSPYGFAKAGDVAGCAMKGFGYVDGELKVEMDHPQQIEPEQVGVQTGDYVIIKGTPNVNMVNSPEVPGGIGTIAMCVNMIPQTINAEPGLKTMIDLPVPRAIMGDMRALIHEDKKVVK